MENEGSSTRPAEPDRESLKSDRSITPPPGFSDEPVTFDPRFNLLKNPRAEAGLEGWEIVENGGDGWVTENNRKPHPDDTVTKCFITSYWLCLKQQLIDLKKEGYSDTVMDRQPHIKISDWFAPRADCGSEYQICVELLDQRKNPIRTFKPQNVVFQPWNDEPWRQMIHVFKDYGPGVRFIRFTHGGKDTQFWKGWYGIRVTNSSVEICPPPESVDHGGELRTRAELRRYACDLTLDPNTANTYLILSEENRKVMCVLKNQPYPDHPERFANVPQVLCGESLTGRCYWEVELSGGAGIAVAYKGISRKGGSDCVFGSNDKSWSLICTDNGFSVRHNKKSTDIPFVRSSSKRVGVYALYSFSKKIVLYALCSSSKRVGVYALYSFSKKIVLYALCSSPKRVGVYLDWSAGTLSFYSISDTHTLTHLHTFNTTFTEPLYAGFKVYPDSPVFLQQRRPTP